MACAATMIVSCGGGAEVSNSGPSEDPVGQAFSATNPSFLLRGKVLDPWSSAVDGVLVRALPVGASEEDAELASVQSDATGSYELELNGAGPFLLIARHNSSGFDRVLSHPLTAGADNVAPILRLAGEGWLGGSVLDAAEVPVQNARVIAYSKALLQRELFFASNELKIDAAPLWPPVLQGTFYEAGSGFSYQEDITDDEGAFMVKGLVPGDYLIFSPALGGEGWVLPNRASYSTGATGIELRSKLCQVEVSVGDDGLPGSPPEPGQKARRLGPIEVFATVPAKGGALPLLGRLIGPYADERNVFALLPGDYIVRAETYPPEGEWGGTMHVETRVHLEAGETLRRVNLEFPELDRPQGRLRVQSVVPEGWDAPQPFHLLSALTGQELECSEYTPYPVLKYGEWLDLPEGEYLIALLPFDDFVGRSEVIEMARCYRRVVIEADRDVESTLHATFGGSFRLQLDADRFVLDQDLRMPGDLLDGERKTLIGLFARTVGATLTVVREGGGPAVLLRLRDPRNRIREERKAMLAGEQFENIIPLEPGNYTIWADAPGYGVASAPLTVTERGKTDVKLRLLGK
ncbi:MAG: hypothetical protein ACI9F9_001654 [Candidatus Paceibacteria bacterium]|jgi:hypothetical protein